jgi:hypothetical protein
MYRVQYKHQNSDWTSGNWINLGSPVVATGSTQTFIDSNLVDPWRAYRVVRLP